jgi:uncharacterized protein
MRDEAIDVARAVAILGMFVIHAVLVLSASYPRSGGSAVVLWLCDGRAAATFVTLAGFGVSRLAAKSAGETGRRLLRRRALVLWIMGVLNLIVWPGDILRVYAVALFIAPWLLQHTQRTRLWLAALLVPAFLLGMVLLDWTQHWQLDTLTYVGVWTPSGFIRNLFFDGFRPVVPWLSFFLLGTVLADVDLHAPHVPPRLLTAGAVATCVAVAASMALDALLVRVAPQLDALTREGLVGTTSLPPLPLFMLSAVGTTALLLGSVLLLLPKLPRAVTDTLVATGRRALTWYVWHIAILMTLYAFGYHHKLSANTSIVCGLLLFAVAVGWSRAKASTNGLLETVMRQLSGATAASPPYVRESA